MQDTSHAILKTLKQAPENKCCSIDYSNGGGGGGRKTKFPVDGAC